MKPFALLSALVLATTARAGDLVCASATDLPCSFGLEPLSVTPAPAGLDVQARLLRAGVPVADGELATVAVRLLHGADLICLEQHAKVPVVDSVINLKVGEDESACFTRAITERASLALQLCIDGGTTCMKPMSLGVSPYALKASFAHTAQTAARAEVAYYSHHALRLVADHDALVRRAIGTGYFDPARPTDSQLGAVLDAADIQALGDGAFLSWVAMGGEAARTLTLAAAAAQGGVVSLLRMGFDLAANAIRVDGGIVAEAVAQRVTFGVGELGNERTLDVHGDSEVGFLDSLAPIACGDGGFDVAGRSTSQSLIVSGQWLVNSGLAVNGPSTRISAGAASLRKTTVADFTDAGTGAVVVDGATEASEGVTVGGGLELVGPSGEVVSVALVPIAGSQDYELQLDPIRATARVSLELPTVFEKPVAFLNEAIFEDPSTITRCAEGFALTISAAGAKSCVDENECLGAGNLAPNSLCPEANKVCVNRKRTTQVEPVPASDPGYTCECAVGWVANSTGTCVAENECTTTRPERRHTCGPDLVCVDKPPGQGDEGRGYACVCPAGQLRSGDNCVSVDECSYVTFQNVAVAKPSWQSSTQEPGKSEAGLANDGNTSGVYPIAHTSTNERSPWWQVDLGEPMAIERVVLWRRTDCCSERLRDLDIKVSMGDATFASAIVAGSVAVPTTTTIPIQLNGARGRYVRVQMRDTGATRSLELGEVQVFVKRPEASPSGQTATCPRQSECVDTPTGHDCTCWAGFVKAGAGAGSTCTEINECTNGTAQCPANSTCTNLQPGASGACPARTICRPPPGGDATAGFGYACACSNGFQVSGDGNSCVDFDECANNPCGVGGSCTNQAPGYACKCAAGYRLTGAIGYAADGRATGLTCSPINECAESAPCGAGGACTDLATGYQCTCQNGYRVTGSLSFAGGTGPGSGVRCNPVNECAENPSICGKGTCTDLTPGYSCSCNAGYRSGGSLTYAADGTASGVKCEDLNECLYVNCCTKFANHHCKWGAGGNSTCTQLDCVNFDGSAVCRTYFDYAGASWGCPNDRSYDDGFTDL